MKEKFPSIYKEPIETLQINIGYKCNQACKHCHVNSSPLRTEKMSNKIIFVDSSSGEVERPSTKKTGLIGISDIYDNLKFDIVFKNGHKEYISWLIELAKKRSDFKKNS